MPASTPRGNIRYPLGTDPPDTDGDIRKVAEDVADRFAMFDESATRPAAGVRGRLHRDPATGQVTWDTGTAWQPWKAGDSDKLGGMSAPLYLLTSDANAAYQPIQNEIYVPASRMNAVVGSPTLGTLTGRYPVWLFDAAVVEQVAGGWDVPASWATVHIDILWTKAGASAAGDVRWQVHLDHAAAGGDLNVSGPVSNIVASSPPQNILKRSRLAAAVAVTAGGWSSVRIQRQAAQADDTLGEDAAFLGVRLVKAS